MYKIELLIGLDAKLAELMIEYPGLMDALPHLGIKLGFEDQSVKEVAEHYNINPEALLVIIYTFCGHLSSVKTVKREALEDLLMFLRNSHNSFKQQSIPELQTLIARFAKEIPDQHGQMLISFFDGYIHEVLEHFKYEDETVFPYINSMLKHEVKSEFGIREFEKNHTDIEQKLLDLKNILIKYIPEEAVSENRRKILRSLTDFEQQLSYHTQLEDQVLAPSVKKVEQKEKRSK